MSPTTQPPPSVPFLVGDPDPSRPEQLATTAVFPLLSPSSSGLPSIPGDRLPVPPQLSTRTQVRWRWHRRPTHSRLCSWDSCNDSPYRHCLGGRKQRPLRRCHNHRHLHHCSPRHTCLSSAPSDSGVTRDTRGGPLHSRAPSPQSGPALAH